MVIRESLMFVFLASSVKKHQESDLNVPILRATGSLNPEPEICACKRAVTAQPETLKR